MGKKMGGWIEEEEKEDDDSRGANDIDSEGKEEDKDGEDGDDV